MTAFLVWKRKGIGAIDRSEMPGQVRDMVNATEDLITVA